MPLRSCLFVSLAVLSAWCPAQAGPTRVASTSPHATVECLVRIGFGDISEEEDGLGVTRDGRTLLLVDADSQFVEDDAVPRLGTAEAPVQILVDDPAAALRALRIASSKVTELVAAPTGAKSLRVELPGHTVAVLRRPEDAVSVAVPRLGEFNDIVLETLARYPADGTHSYHWPKTGSWRGCTKDLEYAGQVLCEGDEQGRAYCCGLTFEVFLDAYRAWCERQARPWRIKDFDLKGVRRLQSQWFGSAADPSCVYTALVSNDLGVRIEDWNEARPGDFVQLWRHSGSGHSVVFLGWERKGKEIVGLRYWSTQPATDGVGERTEWFDQRGVVNGKDQRLDRERIWICRVGVAPND